MTKNDALNRLKALRSKYENEYGSVEAIVAEYNQVLDQMMDDGLSEPVDLKLLPDLQFLSDRYFDHDGTRSERTQMAYSACKSGCLGR